MVRAGTCKYFVHSQHESPVLFDLAHDPAERVNLADDPRYVDVKRELSERLAQRVARPPLPYVDVRLADVR